MEKQDAFLTVGDISRKYGLDRDRVAYVISKHSLPDAGRAGIIRLYTRDQANHVAEVARAIRNGK